MKAIILCAGYAVRLYPLTKDFPKPLLLINKKSIMDYIIEKINEIGITETYVVTNAEFYGLFEKWAKNKKEKITVINDNTLTNDDRLGAIGDINLVINKEKIDEDLFIIGGDSLLKFSLNKAFNMFKSKNENTIAGYDIKDIELAKNFGIIQTDENGKVVSFEEKPSEPKSTVCSTCMYFYPKKTIPLVKKYLDEGNNKDVPGYFVSWLIKNYEVYCATYDEAWYDIGNFELLKMAKIDFGEKDVDIESLKKGIRE